MADTPGKLLSSITDNKNDNSNTKLGGCAGVFVQILDRLHGRKLIPYKLLPAERPKRNCKKASKEDKVPMAKLLLIADENRVGASSRFKAAAEANAATEAKQTQIPVGVVAKLMGIDAIPCPEPQRKHVDVSMNEKEAESTKKFLQRKTKHKENTDQRTKSKEYNRAREIDNKQVTGGHGNTVKASNRVSVKENAIQLRSKSENHSNNSRRYLDKTSLFMQTLPLSPHQVESPINKILFSSKSASKLMSPIKSPLSSKGAACLLGAAVKILEPKKQPVRRLTFHSQSSRYGPAQAHRNNETSSMTSSISKEDRQSDATTSNRHAAQSRVVSRRAGSITKQLKSPLRSVGSSQESLALSTPEQHTVSKFKQERKSPVEVGNKRKHGPSTASNKESKTVSCNETPRMGSVNKTMKSLPRSSSERQKPAMAFRANTVGEKESKRNTNRSTLNRSKSRNSVSEKPKTDRIQPEKNLSMSSGTNRTAKESLKSIGKEKNVKSRSSMNCTKGGNVGTQSRVSESVRRNKAPTTNVKPSQRRSRTKIPTRNQIDSLSIESCQSRMSGKTNFSCITSDEVNNASQSSPSVCDSFDEIEDMQVNNEHGRVSWNSEATQANPESTDLILQDMLMSLKGSKSNETLENVQSHDNDPVTPQNLNYGCSPRYDLERNGCSDVSSSVVDYFPYVSKRMPVDHVRCSAQIKSSPVKDNQSGIDSLCGSEYGQPSPVSILEFAFQETASISSDSFDTPQGKQCEGGGYLLFDTPSTTGSYVGDGEAYDSTVPEEFSCPIKNEDEYIKEVIRSGLMTSEDVLSQSILFGCPLIRPALFNKLEEQAQHFNLMTDVPSGEGAIHDYRLEFGDIAFQKRRLVFDCIQEALDLKLEASKGASVSVSCLPLHLSTNYLFSEVKKQVSLWKEMASSMDFDEIIEKDITTDLRWFYFSEESKQIADIIETSIFTGLMDELVNETTQVGYHYM